MAWSGASAINHVREGRTDKDRRYLQADRFRKTAEEEAKRGRGARLGDNPANLGRGCPEKPMPWTYQQPASLRRGKY